LELPKIREFVKVLVEHETELEKEMKFADSAKVREKIKQLQTLEEQKVLAELLNTHSDEVRLLLSEKEKELKDFNLEYDEMENNINKKFEEMQKSQQDQHDEEYESEMKDFHTAFPEKNPKLTPEILDLYKKLDGVVKKKDYNAAHEIHMKILELTDKHNEKWTNEHKQKKVTHNTNRIKSKQDNKANALKLKMEATLSEFHSKRKVELEKIEQKYFNRMKDLTNVHKSQINELNSPSKITVIKRDTFTKTSPFSSTKGSRKTSKGEIRFNTKVSTTPTNSSWISSKTQNK